MKFTSSIQVLYLLCSITCAAACHNSSSLGDQPAPTVNTDGSAGQNTSIPGGNGMASNPSVNNNIPSVGTIQPQTLNVPGGSGAMSSNDGDSGDANDTPHLAINLFNSMRQAKGLPTVQFSAGLSLRCYNWAVEMKNNSFRHDSSVYGTSERENIAYNSNMDPQAALQQWDGSSGHADAMYDRGFPTGYKAGYGQYQGYAALRICPQNHSPNVCNE